MEDDCNFWFESGYTKEISFIKNKVVGCAYGFDGEGGPLVRFAPQVLSKDSNEFVHGSVVLSNNKFEKANLMGYNFSFKYVKTVELYSNCFDAAYEIEQVAVGHYHEKENIIHH